MRKTFRIVPCKNIERIRELNSELFPHDEFEGPENGNVYWIAKDTTTGEAVGFCSVRPSKLFTDSVFLSRVGVKESARGNGLQRRMVRVRLGWAKRNGFKYALTYTLKDNNPSILNLLKSGFTTYVPQVKYAGDVMYFRKEV